MNGFLQWPCDICTEAIADGDGALLINDEAARANRRIAEGLELEVGDVWTENLKWFAVHYDCRIDSDSLGGFKIERLRTEMDLLWASYHIARLPHLRYANTATLLLSAIRRLEPRDPLTETQRRAILTRDDFKCRACGFRNATGKRLHIDHIYPVALGGSDLPLNLQVLCDRCNLAKGMLTMDRFMEKHGFKEHA